MATTAQLPRFIVGPRPSATSSSSTKSSLQALKNASSVLVSPAMGEPRRLLDGEVGGLGALKNAVYVVSSAVERVGKARAVRHQRAIHGKLHEEALALSLLLLEATTSWLPASKNHCRDSLITPQAMRRPALPAGSLR